MGGRRRGVRGRWEEEVGRRRMGGGEGVGRRRGRNVPIHMSSHPEGKLVITPHLVNMPTSDASHLI